MKKAPAAQPELWGQVDETGRLILEPEVAALYGLIPGSRVRLDSLDAQLLRLRRPAEQLAKVYLEPTNACNLACRTCIRNTWDTEFGYMAEATFAAIIDGLRLFLPPPLVFFGGLGEPLAHPRVVEMVAQVKSLGARVELISNGTLLDETMSARLIDAGLDMLWVSLDGARPESYADVRLGASLRQVLVNVANFRQAGLTSGRPSPEFGIAFVAMQRNIADLPKLMRIGLAMDASRLQVSNVLPYTAEMETETLYGNVLSEAGFRPAPQPPHLTLPKMDTTGQAGQALQHALGMRWSISQGGHHLAAASGHCPFIESGSTAIGWDGSLSPCIPLLYDHTSYLNGRQRFSRHYTVGNVAEQGLDKLWAAPEYVAFREKVQAFNFSPCTACLACEMTYENEEDCFGNEFPVCGSCLWARGVIQCP